MIIRKILSPIAFLLLFCVANVHAAPIAADEYRIDMTVLYNGSLIGKPAIVAKAGAEAEIKDENPMKPDKGFRILVTAIPLDAPADGTESVKLQLTFFGRLKGKWIQRGEHSVTMVTGRSVSFAFPSKSPEAAGKNYDVVLSVNQNSGGKSARQPKK